MNLEELISQQVRGSLDDLTAPYLWSDVELVSYANRCMDELCEKAHPFTESQVDAICKIELATGVALYPLDPRVIYIYEVQTSWTTAPLFKRSAQDLTSIPGWAALTGEPIYYITDFQTAYLLLYYVPTATYDAEHLDMTVSRYQLTELSATNMAAQTPELNSHEHFALVDGILSYAWSKSDAETLQPDKAKEHKAYWLGHIDRITRKQIKFNQMNTTNSPLFGHI